MTEKMIALHDRAILEINGMDRKKFLQGLITNDINKVGEKNLIYTAMLNAQGRFLYDFFIFELEEKLIIDCYKPRRDEILQKLNFYKLRSKVDIKKNDEMAIFSSISAVVEGFSDPRNKNLGNRIYKNHSQVTENKDIIYTMTRINNKIPESEYDLTYEKSFIAEFGFDDLNAIDYQKGCYVGQEPTARIHHLGEIRKKIFHIKIANLQKIEKNSEISCEGKSVGIVLSSVFYQNELHALALIKIAQDQNFLEFDQNKISIVA